MMIINKIIDDTLKVNGKWSRKSIMLIGSFFMSVGTGIYILTSHLFSETPPDINSINVFYGFLGSAVGTGFLTIQDKKNEMIHGKKPEE